jgi:hypothetical protein
MILRLLYQTAGPKPQNLFPSISGNLYPTKLERTQLFAIIKALEMVMGSRSFFL